MFFIWTKKEVIKIEKLLWGCTPQIEYYKNDNYEIGRILSVNRGLYKIITENGQIDGELGGSFKYDDIDLSSFPTVGDFIEYEKSTNHNRVIIQNILPRKSFISRKARGTLVQEQIIASNVDYIFIVSSLNKDINIRRIERYLSSAYDSNATPIILLTKADLLDNYDNIINSIREISPYTDIIPISAYNDYNIDMILNYMGKGKTSVLVGSSGVGKSTLINKLLGKEFIKTQDVRSKDDKGRHTTTNRDLYFIPSGGMIIDTPGMRSLGLWETSEEGLNNTFSDIVELSLECKFNDCTHNSEPGCRIKDALNTGELDVKRYRSYLALQRESNYYKQKEEIASRKANKEKHKKHIIKKRRLKIKED